MGHFQSNLRQLMLGTRWDMGYMRTRHYMGILYGIKWDTLVMTSSLLWKITQGPFYRGKKTIWTSGFRDSPISERPMSYILIPKAGRMTMMIPLDVHKSYTFWAGFNRQPEDIWWRCSSITSTMLCICAVFIVSVLLHALVGTDTLASRSDSSESAPPCRV